MAFSRFYLLFTLLTLPVLVAQWVGILGLRKARKDGAWWTMAAGVACSTIGIMLSLAGMFVLTQSGGSLIWFCLSSIPSFGSLLFAVGFARHGMQASRASDRVQELEQVAAAMSEEMARTAEAPKVP